MGTPSWLGWTICWPGASMATELNPATSTNWPDPATTDTDDAILWIGATDAGFAPWLAPGGREDGGITTAPDARRTPSVDFTREDDACTQEPQ